MGFITYFVKEKAVYVVIKTAFVQFEWLPSPWRPENSRILPTNDQTVSGGIFSPKEGMPVPGIPFAIAPAMRSSLRDSKYGRFVRSRGLGRYFR